jgi:DNA-binding response OmpR family regulator
MTMTDRSVSVLVADDEEALLDLASRFLRRHGYRVVPARSGEEALLVFERSLEPIYVAVLDLCLPDIDGVTVYRRLLAGRPGLGVVFASGREEDELPEDLRTDGRVSFLQKPFRGCELLQAVDRLLEGAPEPPPPLSSRKGRRTAPAASSGGCP